MTETPTDESDRAKDGGTTAFRPNPKSPREAIQPEQAPQPPARSRHVRNPFVIVINAILSIAVLTVIAVAGLLYWGKAEFEAPGPLAAEKTVIISSGSGLQAIADTLENQGVIENAYVFLAGVRPTRTRAS